MDTRFKVYLMEHLMVKYFLEEPKRENMECWGYRQYLALFKVIVAHAFGENNSQQFFELVFTT